MTATFAPGGERIVTNQLAAYDAHLRAQFEDIVSSDHVEPAAISNRRAPRPVQPRAKHARTTRSAVAH